ncbi:MAG: hypothetical protein PHH30_08465 [Bacteroidales bacterium]|nr:hypothetical protein [Bacteroidales bacterium]MDD3858930.1 hypothetical protein [Bacteroidales bacterium]
MAELTISGRMLVKTLKSKFNESFNLHLRVYKGNKFADDESTLASLSDKKVESFSAGGNMHISTFEEKFEKATGLKVQVADQTGDKLVNNSLPLSAGKKA